MTAPRQSGRPAPEALDEAGKRAVVANCAVARELACWCWALGCMVEAA